MRGGALPPALLCVALGLALAFAPRQGWRPSLNALAVTAIALAAPVPPGWLEGVFLGCWMSLAASAATVHLPALLRRGLLPAPGLGVTGERCHGRENLCGLLCKLDKNCIKVKLSGTTVEVCCDECAQKLKEAQASAGVPRKG
jgi:hypothetical protein